MDSETYDARRKVVHDSIAGLLRDGEIAVSWSLTIDVAQPDGGRYLAHRAGGGHDGSDEPTIWAVMGMTRGSLLSTEQQLVEATYDPDDEDD
jgi:hypothetical protein